MKPLYLRLLLVFSLAAPALAGTRATPEFSGEGQNLNLPTAPLVQPGAPPVAVDLNIAPLNNVQVEANGALALSQVQLPVLEPAPGLVAAPQPKADDTMGPLMGWRTPEASADFTRAAEGSAPTADQEVLSGRRQFDRQTSNYSLPAALPSVRRWLSDLWKGADRVPAWPGKAGDQVKLDGKTYVLVSRAGEGNSAVVWKARQGGNDAAVKFIHPEFKNIPLYGAEVLSLEAIGHTDVPHARLLAKSADGLVIVKEYVEGDKASDLISQGGLIDRQRDGFAELAARLVRIGYTADIHPNNLIWERWHTRFSLADVGGFQIGRPWTVLSQILDGPPVKSGALKPVAFLSALRGRLGPDSEGWRRVLEDAAKTPALARHLAELFAYDRGLKPAPRPAFGRAPEEPILSDALVSRFEVKKRLGYDPLTVTPRRMLHGDDPGKLNTQVFEIAPQGKDPVVVKIAAQYIIRHELAVRLITRRFFGGHFRTPGALAVDRGFESFMVMSKVDGSPSYALDAMDLPHRVAMAVLAQTFGLGDVNQGNVLTRPKSDPALIDFEQAFERRAPNVSRIPDERIALEMPWVSLHAMNRIEDYLPAIKAWRALFLEPQTQAELARILRESGYSDKEIPGYLALFRANADDLEWAIQNDVEFANLFVERRSPR